MSDDWQNHHLRSVYGVKREVHQAVLDAAAHLLNNRSRHGTEGNVQSDVEALLRAIGVGTIESHYQIGKDQADIYLPNRRTFIECKAFPKAATPEKQQDRKSRESPREQLDRYVKAEINNELSMLPGFSDVPNANWTGIITDGANWHVYTYPHEAHTKGRLHSKKEFFSEGDALTSFLTDILGTDMMGKEWIPRDPGDLFTDLKDELDGLYLHKPSKADAPTFTKQKLWLDMMQTSGMVPTDVDGQNRLFLAHSFLIIIIRMVSHTLNARQDEPWKHVIRDGFASWVLDFKRGDSWTDKVWERVNGYDWRKRRGDVLRDLYHRYVSERDRKVFGEFYTPDWLAALMVEEVLDEHWIKNAVKSALNECTDGIGVLDPACGSGTFLYHAALRILASPSVKDLRPAQKANVVARLVNGMDIHPVAVEIARVNIERALPSEPTEGASAFRIFLGDSLRVETRGDLLFRDNDFMQLITPNGYEASIPMRFVESPSFAENMRRMVNAAAQGEPLPDGISSKVDFEVLKQCHQDLINIIEVEGNSVWTWYAVNLAGPYLLSKRKIDRIVGNPPWVKLSDIQVLERKRVMEALGHDLGLQQGGRQAPHLDIASYFVLRTRKQYAADPDSNPASWLVKKSAIRSGQWARFRGIHAKTLVQSVDLQNINPFGGGDATRCCLLMEHRGIRGTQSSMLEVKPTTARRPSMHDTLNTARGMFEFIEAPKPLPQAPSDYVTAGFRQGATIVPHVLVMIVSKSKASQPGWTYIETQLSRHHPWSSVSKQKGLVPTKWVRRVHTSPDLLPYMALRNPPEAIIPVQQDGQMHREPGRDCAFWEELDEIYDAHKGKGKQTPQTLIQRLNFASNLSSQPFTHEVEHRIVLYPSSGDIMRAARTQMGEAVANATLYWLAVSSKEEAGYLVAILNARCLRRGFAECRESGRDFCAHPWRKMPIPRYNKKDHKHQRLAKLCTAAEQIVIRKVDEVLETRPTLGQPGLSKVLRETLEDSDEGQEIEQIVARLMPAQVDSSPA